MKQRAGHSGARRFRREAAREELPLRGGRLAEMAARTWVQIGLLIVLAIAPYLNSLWGEFHFDDITQVVRNRHLHGFHQLLGARPIARWFNFFTLFVNYQAHGPGWMPGWHLANILLHAIAVLCVYGTVRLLCGAAERQTLPALTAALFAVHPLASEPVNYIQARSSILYTIFSLASLCGVVLAMRAESVRRRIAWGALAFVCILLGSLSKEVGVLFTVGVPLLYLAIWVGPRLGRRKAIVILGTTALALAAIAAVWLKASGAYAGIRERFDGRLADYFWCQATVLWRYAAIAAWPAPSMLSIDHYVPDYTARPYTIAQGDVLAAAMGILALLVIAWRLRRGRPIVSFAILLTLVGLSPWFVMDSPELMVEYRCYLPLAGFCIIAAALLQRLGRVAFLMSIAPVLIGTIIVAMAAATAVRNRAWRTEVSIWEDAVEKAPRKARPASALAWALLRDPQRRDPVRALQLARRSLDDSQVDLTAGYSAEMGDTLAEALSANGYHREAIAIERELIRRGKGDVEFFREQLAKFESAAGKGSD